MSVRDSYPAELPNFRAARRPMTMARTYCQELEDIETELLVFHQSVRGDSG